MLGAACATAALAAGAAPAPAAEPVPLGATAVPGELIVQFERGVPGSERAAARRRAGVQAERAMLAPGQQVVRVGEDGSSSAAVARLERDPRVEYAQPNYIRRKREIPNDPLFPGPTGQWGLLDDRTAATLAWDQTTGSPGVPIAVVDEGVAYDHLDLAANVWTNTAENTGAPGVDDDGNGCVDDIHGCDIVDGDGDPRDLGGHGTHVAGIAAAVGNNGTGIAGMNWTATILPVRVLDFFGGSDADVADGFRYAVHNGARVVNASLGGPGASPAMEDAIASAPNVLFVVAAGNASQNNDTASGGEFPCNIDLPNLICVAATDRNDQLAGFSNTGPTSVDLGAPGVDVRSTVVPRSEDFAENFDSSAGFEIRWGAADSSWQLAPNHPAPDSSPSPDEASVTDSLAGPYPQNANLELEKIAAIDLDGQLGCTLRMDLALALGFDPTPGLPLDEQDALLVETSPDGGVWTPVGGFIGGTGDSPSDSDTLPDFELVEVDLRADGEQVFIRFRLEDNGDGVQGDGAYVDNVDVGCSAPDPAGSYAPSDGTSMAAPHVAGAAALVVSARPSLTITQLRHVLLTSGDPLPTLAGNTVTGRRLDVNAALTAPADPPAPPPPPPPPPPPDPPQPQPRIEPPAPDTTAPRVSFALTRGQRLRTLIRRGLRGQVGCDEACSLRAEIVIDARTARRLGLTRGRRAVVVGRRSMTLDRAGRRRRLTIRITRRARARLGRARSVRFTVRLRAQDQAGNRRTVSRRARLRR